MNTIGIAQPAALSLKAILAVSGLVPHSHTVAINILYNKQCSLAGPGRAPSGTASHIFSYTFALCVPDPLA